MAEPLPYLDTFVRAAEIGSFTAAARALGLTQAAVSQRIAALERELGVPVFSRQGGRIALTDAGRRLHELANQIQQLHDLARAELSGQTITATGELDIAASTVPGEYLLPDVLPKFQSRHPHVHLRVRIVDSRAVFDLVEQGQAHLGLAGDRAENPHLAQQRFARDEMLLVLPARHALAKRGCITLPEMLDQPLIVRESGSGSRHCLEQALARAGYALSDFSLALELGSNEAVLGAVRRGQGVAFLSSLALAAQSKPLPTVRVGCLDLSRDLFAVHDRRRALSIPARLFLDLLLEAVP